MSGMYIRKGLRLDGPATYDLINPENVISITAAMVDNVTRPLERDGDLIHFRCANGTWTYRIELTDPDMYRGVLIGSEATT